MEANLSKHHFLAEILGRVVVAGTCIYGYSKEWWLPLIIAPLFWKIWDSWVCPKGIIIDKGYKLFADFTTYIICLLYIAYSVWVFHININHWYGWIIGLMIGIVVGHFLGFLFPRRWHLEAVTERL